MVSVTTIASPLSDKERETKGFSGLRSPRLLARRPIIGLLMFIFGGLAFGALTYLLAPRMPSLFWKIVVGAAAALIMAFVGFNRIFTGGHYLTDVLAGYAIGIAWSGAGVYVDREVLSRKKDSKWPRRISLRMSS
jgi:hypothetical protein